MLGSVSTPQESGCKDVFYLHCAQHKENTDGSLSLTPGNDPESRADLVAGLDSSFSYARSGFSLHIQLRGGSELSPDPRRDQAQQSAEEARVVLARVCVSHDCRCSAYLPSRPDRSIWAICKSHGPESQCRAFVRLLSSPLLKLFMQEVISPVPLVSRYESSVG